MAKFSLNNLFSEGELKLYGIIAVIGLLLAVIIPLIIVFATRPKESHDEPVPNIFDMQDNESSQSNQQKDLSVTLADFYFPKPAFAEFQDGWVNFRDDAVRWNDAQVEALTGKDEDVLRAYFEQSTQRILEQEFRDVP